MEAVVEGLKWFLSNFGLPVVTFLPTFGILLYLLYRNTSADTLRTVNGMQIQQAAQLAQLQTDYRNLNKLYIELLKLHGKTSGDAQVADNKLHNFMVIYEADKIDWTQERDRLKAEIAELKSQVKELLQLVKLRDAEINDLKKDNLDESESK